MASEWQERTLGELTENFDGVRVPVKEADRRSGPYPYYGASGVVDHVDRFLFDGEYLLIAEDGENLRTRTTPVAFMARGKFWVNNHAHIVRGNDQADTRFLMYALAAANIGGYLTGSTMPKLTQGNMNRIPLHIPPLLEQTAIANILGTLDDKIELNRRMSETLEAMASALFKTWFVDFDPVLAKMEGRDSDLPKPVAEQFPARLVDSELGDIPEGWEVGVLDDFVETVIGGDWGADVRDAERTEAVHCIRGADIPDLQIGGSGKMPIRYLKPSSLAKRRLSDCDLVLEISGGSPTQSTGRPVLVSRELLHRLHLPLVCSNFCRFLKLRSPIQSKFVYLWLRSLYSNDEFLQFENGTTGIKNLAFTQFSSTFKLAIPPVNVLEAFDQRVAPLFLRQQIGAAENETLAALRDALLPKLISGELRVMNTNSLAAKSASGSRVRITKQETD
jgi:type I restriction enzyme S subunit